MRVTRSAFCRIGKISFPWERLSLLGAILAMMTFLSCTLTPGNEIFGGVGGCRGCVVSLALVWDIIKTRNTSVNQRAFLDRVHYTSAQWSPQSAHKCLLLSVGMLLKVSPLSLCCFTLCLHTRACCAHLSVDKLDKTNQGRPGGSRTEEDCFPHILSRSGCQSSEGRGFYPLMNWDCWSKVWIIEFLINYPELLSDKSAPLHLFCGGLFDLVCVLLLWACPSLSLPHQCCPCHGDWCFCVSGDLYILMLMVGFVLCFGKYFSPDSKIPLS